MPTINSLRNFAQSALQNDGKVDVAEAQKLIEKASSAPQQYTVQNGDKLGAVAQRFNTTIAALKAANPQITSMNQVQTGTKINIPGEVSSDALKAELKAFYQANQANFDADAKVQMAGFLGVEVVNTPVQTATSSGQSGGSVGTSMDVRLGRVEIPTPASTPDSKVDKLLGLRPATLAYKGEASFPGPWKMASTELSMTYNNISAEQFGTTNVKLPTGDVVNVRDMHYDVGDGKMGMRFVPVNDGGSMQMPDGTVVEGHVPMDNFLRQEMGLGADDPVFAFIAYIHPEKNTGDLGDLAKNQLKTEMGQTHMGTYLGEGKTSNSPETYHGREWEVEGYPANVQMLTLQGVDQGTLNKNGQWVDKMLNSGVKFPSNYKEDAFRTIDLNTNLMFYRDWINNEPHLRSDPSWHCYCAEHKTIIANVMTNLPHNEAAFKETFGDEDGAKLWSNFKDKFKTSFAREFTAADETHFEPLWKKEGFSAEQIRPFKDLDAYNAYDEARRKGTLDSFDGFKALDVGQGMCWAPETTSDLLHDFVETYASFVDHNAVVSGSVLLGFVGTAKERMGLDDEQFFGLALPFVNKMMAAEAMVSAHGDPETWMKQTTGAMYVALGGKKEDFAEGGTVHPQIMGLAQNCMQAATAQLPELLAAGPKTRDEAYTWLRGAIDEDVAKLRKLGVKEGSVEHYSPPAVTHRVSIGMQEKSAFVDVKTLCTAVSRGELEPK